MHRTSRNRVEHVSGGGRLGQRLLANETEKPAEKGGTSSHQHYFIGHTPSRGEKKGTAIAGAQLWRGLR